MIPAMKTEYEGWEICTACWDEVSEDWQPGDPTLYCASGYAVMTKPNAYTGKWLSQLKQTVPANREMLFSDFNAAHATIAGRLRLMIEALKVH